MKPKLQYIVSILIFIGFIAVIEHYFDWKTILHPWHKLGWPELLVTLLLLFTSYLARTMRIYDYFQKEIRGMFAQCLKLILYHNMLNNLLPMRTGEISFPLLMARYFDIPSTKSIPALLWLRILDLHTLLAIALLATANQFFGTSISVMLFIFWMATPLILLRSNKSLLKKLDSLPENRFQILLSRCLSSLPQHLRALIHTWLWTWANWTIKLSASCWIILLFHDTSINIAFMGAIMGDLSSVLPIHGVGGFGTYEAGIMAGLIPLDMINTNVNKETALQAAVYLHLIILGSAIMGGGIAMIMPNKFLKNNAS